MFCDLCGTEAIQNASYCQCCGSKLGRTNNKRYDVSSYNPVKEKNEQFIEQPPKDESKSFLGGVYHPWRRLFSRMIDPILIVIIIMPVFFLFLFLVSLFSIKINIDGFVLFIANPLVLFVLMILVEPLFLSVIGTTPARWVFGICVTNQTGEKLTYGQALKRELLVLIQGCGFGIPLVNLFTMFFAYRRLTKTGTTLWDTSTCSVVTHKKWGIIRTIASIFVTLIALVLLAAIDKHHN